MSAGANPITTAIRNWTLRSPARLAAGVAILFGVVLIGRLIVTAIVGTDSAGTETVADPNAGGSVSVSLTSEAGKEVTEKEVVAMPTTSAVRSPASAAMYYAHAFLDTTASPTQWAVALSRVTRPERVTDSIAGARPTTPVAILSPTRTLPETTSAAAIVEIDTSAGVLKIRLTANDGDWQVDGPLPTLGLVTATTTPRSTTTSPTTTTARTSTSTTPDTTSTQPAPSPTAAPPAQQATSPAPVPVPGPIPLPELDTPLPGPLT
ncbi:hypothetical protein [Rhodococcus qingshengii]|uniref:hypothetical protein n=1 Tax=Rhodococcus qingshengii TaxID=334542 RepID=UPI0027A770CD|nr:hypothetical protein PI247_31175 [Rhodococcus qingshengii]